MKKLLISIAVVLIAGLLYPAILAQASDPSEAEITMLDVQGYRNLGTSGDVLIIGHYEWSSDNTVSAAASSAVVIRYIAANGTTLATISPYVYSLFDDNGWGEIVFSFYYTSNTTWGTAASIEIVGLPVYFSDPPYLPYTLNASDYTTSTTQADNREEMALYVLSLCDELGMTYTDIELKSGTGQGDVLSSYGEAYFTAAIPGIETLCPELFVLQTYVPETIEIQDYSMDLSDVYTDRLAGEDLMNSADAVGAYIDVSGYVVLSLITCAGMIVLVIYLIGKRGWRIEAALGITFLIPLGMSLLIGDLLFTVVMIVAFIALIGIAFAVFGKRG